jgi:hypothetical protein
MFTFDAKIAGIFGVRIFASACFERIKKNFKKPGFFL